MLELLPSNQACDHKDVALGWIDDEGRLHNDMKLLTCIGCDRVFQDAEEWHITKHKLREGDQNGRGANRDDREAGSMDRDRGPTPSAGPGGRGAPVSRSRLALEIGFWCCIGAVAGVWAYLWHVMMEMNK